MIRVFMLAAAGLLLAAPAKAQTAPVTWTGFYLGANIGGGWGNRNLGYTGNDVPASNLLAGISPFSGNEPVRSHGVALRGVTGGVEAGYDWQTQPWLVVGVAADFSVASISGSGSSTSILALAFPGGPVFATQTITAAQTVEWWGTLRARAGFLPADNLLLYATAGLAYGQVARSSAYRHDAPPGTTIAGTRDGYSYRCPTAGATCFSGSHTGTEVGWTLGAGGEWRWWGQWSVKAEYLYVNLGKTSVDPAALAVSLAAPASRPSSYNAAFGTTDFHVARAGVSYRF